MAFFALALHIIEVIENYVWMLEKCLKYASLHTVELLCTIAE